MIRVVSTLAAFLIVAAIVPTVVGQPAPGYERKSVRDYGALGDGVNDDYAALQRALDDAAHRCVVFPPGTYVHSRFLNLRASNSCLLAESGVTLSNRSAGTSGYLNDGIRVGDASDRDDGAGTGINIHDIYISGFRFDAEGRIGVWVVYARDVTVENIAGSGVAVVAVGNDADDECERIVVRNVTRTGPTPADWYTVGIFNTEHFLLEDVTSTYSVGSQAVAVTNSRWGTVQNITIDQQDSLHDGIALLDSKYISVSNFTVSQARKGVVIYSDFLPPSRAAQFNTVGPGRIQNSSTGIHIYTRNNQIRGVEMSGVVKTVVLGSDASTNTFVDDRPKVYDHPSPPVPQVSPPLR